MADITRDQFNETKNVQRKVVQKRIYLTDADLNEQFTVGLFMNRRLLSCVTSHEHKRFGNGFLVEGTGASLQVTVRAGFAAFQIGTSLAALLRLEGDTTVSGFTAWSGSRTDHVYLDIWEEEFSPAEDPDIVNPHVGAETCRDIRQKFTFNISEGTAPGSPPAGHTYVTIATVSKTSGSTIQPGDVISVIPDFNELPDDIVTTSSIQDGAVTTSKIGASAVGQGNIADDAVIEAKIQDGAVSTNKIADSAVTSIKIDSGAVTQSKLATGAVGNSQLADDTVSTSKILDDAIEASKLHSNVAGYGLALGANGLNVQGIVQTVGMLGFTLRLGVLEIGDWNMDTTSQKQVPHELFDSDQILWATAMIREDEFAPRSLLTFGSVSTGDVHGSITWNDTYIILDRRAGGMFDSTAYDSTGFNRGWIVFLYRL